MNQSNILVVDDEPKYLFFLKLNLESYGYTVVTAANGTTALAQMLQTEPDAVLLDIAMPPPDGFEICRRIRQISTVPVIMVTSKDDTQTKITGFEVGADDYVTKPFNFDELAARISANLRRVQMDRQRAQSAIIQIEQLKIDRLHQQVFLLEKEIPLTEVEYAVLDRLCRNLNRVCSSEQLLQAVWQTDVGDINTLRQTIFRLRQKLETDPKNPRYIQNRARLGYILVT
jgi:DNA-binding response OmpR family regulator